MKRTTLTIGQNIQTLKAKADVNRKTQKTCHTLE